MAAFLPTFLTAGLLGVMLLLVSSCMPAGPTLQLRMTDAAANNHIMFIRADPPTLGYRRLNALAAYYPDLETFLKWHGAPTYLAETNKSKNRYLILYYPASKKAFACRSGTGHSRSIEFSGPHPITPNELKTLKNLESGKPIAANR